MYNLFEIWKMGKSIEEKKELIIVWEDGVGVIGGNAE